MEEILSLTELIFTDAAILKSKISLFAEFLSIAHRNPIALSLRTVFDEIDVDGDGYLRRSELRQAFQRMGHTLTDSDMNAIYRHVDTNNDGRINFDGN